MSGRGRERSGVGPRRAGGPEVCLVLVTGPDADTLVEMGRRVVEERHCACANVLAGLSSVYRWEGAVEEAEEAMALLKTTKGRLEALETRVRALHPYDEPEFLVVETDGGSASYLEWVAASVTEARP